MAFLEEMNWKYLSRVDFSVAFHLNLNSWLLAAILFSAPIKFLFMYVTS